MSYTLEIWTRSFPDDERAAWRVRDTLLAEQEAGCDPEDPFEPASPEMVELHGRLTARFPCICDDDSGPWSDGPLINDFGQGNATVGIVYSRVEEVVPFVVETATGMGMHVFDGQDEVLHRPVGYVSSSSAPSKGSRSWWQFWR